MASKSIMVLVVLVSMLLISSEVVARKVVDVVNQEKVAGKEEKKATSKVIYKDKKMQATVYHCPGNFCCNGGTCVCC